MKLHFEARTIDAVLRELTASSDKVNRLGLLTGRVQGEDIHVEGVIIPSQKASGNMCTVDDDAWKQAFSYAAMNRIVIVALIEYEHGNHLYEKGIIGNYRRVLASRGMPNLSVIMNWAGGYETYS